jgi:hypothetical protein
MEVDEDEDLGKKPVKKQKQSHKAGAQVLDSVDEKVGDMSKYRNQPSWDGLIKHIDTVEMEATSKKLFVYFTLCVIRPTSQLHCIYFPSDTMDNASKSLQRSAKRDFLQW